MARPDPAKYQKEVMELAAIVCTGDIDKYLDCSKKKELWTPEFIEEISKPFFYWITKGKNLIQQDYKSWRLEFDKTMTDDKE